MRLSDIGTTPAIQGSANGLSRLDTSEVRWFASGGLPAGLVEQFCDTPGSASIEIRTDTYRVGSSPGVGLKRRDGGPLELKIRQSRVGHLRFCGSVDAAIEDWSKIIGLNHPVLQDERSWQWSEVQKVILTRTYGFMSTNRVGPVERIMPGLGCDVELAAVKVGELEAWTFALEAWGPVRDRRRLLGLVLAAHTDELPFPDAVVASLEHAMGYPEWLATVAAARI